MLRINSIACDRCDLPADKTPKGAGYVLHCSGCGATGDFDESALAIYLKPPVNKATITLSKQTFAHLLPNDQAHTLENGSSRFTLEIE